MRVRSLSIVRSDQNSDSVGELRTIDYVCVPIFKLICWPGIYLCQVQKSVTYLLTYLPTYLPTYVPTYLHSDACDHCTRRAAPAGITSSLEYTYM